MKESDDTKATCKMRLALLMLAASVLVGTITAAAAAITGSAGT